MRQHIYAAIFIKLYGSTSGILRLELYHWMGTYEATLESEPVAADEFEVVSDGNSNTKVVFGFDEQLDGEYLLVATPGSDSYSDVIYFWAKVGATQFHTRAYIDDTELPSAGGKPHHGEYPL